MAALSSVSFTFKSISSSISSSSISSRGVYIPRTVVVDKARVRMMSESFILELLRDEEEIQTEHNEHQSIHLSFIGQGA